MKLLGVVAVGILLALSLVAGQAPRNAVGIINGVVVDEQKRSEPVARAVVSIRREDGSGRRTVLADEKGRFGFVNVELATYVVTATKSGFVPAALGSVVPFGLPKALSVFDDKPQSVTLTMLRGGSVSGEVVDRDGTPLRRAPVTARRRQFAHEGLSYAIPAGVDPATTDERGRYRIFGLPPGEYVVSVEVPGSAGDATFRPTTEADIARAMREFEASVSRADSRAVPSSSDSQRYVTSHFPSTPNLGESQVIIVTAGQETAGINIRRVAIRPVRLTGVVIPPGGLPPTNVRLWARPGGPGMPDSSNLRYQPDGSFSASGFVPGRYILGASATARYAGEVNATQDSLWARLPIQVDQQDMDGLVLQLQYGAGIAGSVEVVGGALAATPGKVTISLFEVGEAVWYSVPSGTTRADGSFSIANVAVGSYYVAVEPPSGSMVKALSFGGKDQLDQPVDVSPSSNGNELRIVLSQNNEVSGTVTEAAGTPTADFAIVLFSTDRRYWIPRSGRLRGVRPRLDGRYLFSGIPSGEYFIAAIPDVERGRWFDPAFLDSLVPLSRRLRIGDAPRTTHDIRITR